MPVELFARDVGTGMPLVLLHALPLSSAMWLAQREVLGADHRVLTPDLRGFGGSPLGDDPPSLDAMADDVAALLDARGIERAVVGGLSMGGCVAMALVRRHVHRVSALVLADTRAAADAPEAAANRERIAALVEADPGSSVLVDELLPKLVGPTTIEQRPLVYGRVRALVQAAPAAAVAWAQRAMAARPDSFDTLRAVTVPVLVVVGEEDEPSPPAEATAMAATVKDGRLVVVPRAGHLSAVENPEAFNAAVSEFLRSLGTL
jgi:pimeloyl-ACP methyl ester carboxylesterase